MERSEKSNFETLECCEKFRKENKKESRKNKKASRKEQKRDETAIDESKSKFGEIEE